MARVILRGMLSRGKQVRRVRTAQDDLASLRRELASLRSVGARTSRIGWGALFVSVVAIVLASLAIATESRHARTYVSVAVAVTVLASFAAVLIYIARVEAHLYRQGEGALSVLSRSWRFVTALSLALALGVTLALTLSAEGALNLGIEGERGPTGKTGPAGQPGHTVTLHQTISVDRTVTINKTATIDHTVTLNRTVYVAPTLPPTR
jgi:hypothetical protein